MGRGWWATLIASLEGLAAAAYLCYLLARLPPPAPLARRKR
jgi:hypothetical protein